MIWKAGLNIANAVENETNFFILFELHKLYENRLKDFGIDKSVNRFRLKNGLLNAFPEAQDQNDVRQTTILFREGLKSVLLKEAALKGKRIM